MGDPACDVRGAGFGVQLLVVVENGIGFHPVSRRLRSGLFGGAPKKPWTEVRGLRFKKPPSASAEGPGSSQRAEPAKRRAARRRAVA